MTPTWLLLYVALGIVLFNILTVKFRERRFARLEKGLRALAEKKGDEITLQQISQELQIPLYDAKILARKFVSKGKMEPKKAGGKEEAYVFKT